MIVEKAKDPVRDWVGGARRENPPKFPKIPESPLCMGSFCQKKSRGVYTFPTWLDFPSLETQYFNGLHTDDSKLLYLFVSSHSYSITFSS